MNKKKQISSFEYIEKMISKPNILSYDIYMDSICIGFAMLRKYMDNGYFLWNYAIDKRYQNKGYGSKALMQMLKNLKTRYHTKVVTTTYLWGNTHAKHIYEKIGFAETDVVDEDDVHEVNMIKYL